MAKDRHDVVLGKSSGDGVLSKRIAPLSFHVMVPCIIFPKAQCDVLLVYFGFPAFLVPIEPSTIPSRNRKGRVRVGTLVLVLELVAQTLFVFGVRQQKMESRRPCTRYLVNQIVGCHQEWVSESAVIVFPFHPPRQLSAQTDNVFFESGGRRWQLGGIAVVRHASLQTVLFLLFRLFATTAAGSATPGSRRRHGFVSFSQFDAVLSVSVGRWFGNSVDVKNTKLVHTGSVYLVVAPVFGRAALDLCELDFHPRLGNHFVSFFLFPLAAGGDIGQAKGPVKFTIFRKDRSVGLVVP
mmetsp:Transcript_3186/g.8796  ORF Transcript_3186/g.8796 Transcript_3186/m.8796 type:complete len:295 (-) Transcript_3186:620-1504(-)